MDLLKIAKLIFVPLMSYIMDCRFILSFFNTPVHSVRLRWIPPDVRCHCHQFILHAFILINHFVTNIFKAGTRKKTETTETRPQTTEEEQKVSKRGRVVLAWAKVGRIVRTKLYTTSHDAFGDRGQTNSSLLKMRKTWQCLAVFCFIQLFLFVGISFVNAHQLLKTMPF